ncbi:class I glutamine amidotransferase-like protein [Auricularia subglabra TFB-10046 SS5]|nr:class I glutamine amidotransferase-like protein [Auricularia subglabra TFB-10046 SS5]
MAVRLFDDVEPLDYLGPVDLFGFLNATRDLHPLVAAHNPEYRFDFTYVGPSAEVQPVSGPALKCTATFGEVLDVQFDVVLVPGGPGAHPGHVPQGLLNFVKKQADGAKYVLSVCTGSYALAQAGVLDGKRATTNKAAFKSIEADTVHTSKVTLVPEARWVVDGKFWTSSGVTAGLDMATAWLEHLVGQYVTLAIRSIVEYSSKRRDDDEWADFWQLTVQG